MQDNNMMMDAKLVDSLLQVNQLSYRMPPQISIAQKVTHTIMYSQQSQYNNGQTVVFDMQSGNSFVDATCSYLRFVVTPSAGTHSFGSGSCQNLFERVVVRTRSGRELSRCENLNLLNKFMDRYMKSDNWQKTVGKSMGYSQESKTAAIYGDAVPAAGKLYVVPLCSLAGCFNIIGSKLLPPQMMSGLRIEIRLADPSCFSSVSQAGVPANLASYTIDRPEIHLKEYTLNDNFARKISEMANQGLNCLYFEHYNTIVATTTNAVNYDIKKAVSKAVQLSVISREQANINEAGRDIFQATPFSYETIQSNCGSDYIPNQPLQLNGTADANNINEMYYYALEESNKLEPWDPSSVTPQQYLGRENDGTENDVFSNGMVVFNWNRSNTSQLAGYTVSNSRSLLINLKQEGVAKNLRIDTYLTFIRLAKYMNTNALVLD